jgi:hypothetical protein
MIVARSKTNYRANAGKFAFDGAAEVYRYTIKQVTKLC